MRSEIPELYGPSVLHAPDDGNLHDIRSRALRSSRIRTTHGRGRPPVQGGVIMHLMHRHGRPLRPGEAPHLEGNRGADALRPSRRASRGPTA